MHHSTHTIDVKITMVTGTTIKSVLRRKIWKRQEASVISDFSSYGKEFKKTSEADGSVEDFWEVLKGKLLEATEIK